MWRLFGQDYLRRFVLTETMTDYVRLRSKAFWLLFESLSGTRPQSVRRRPLNGAFNRFDLTKQLFETVPQFDFFFPNVTHKGIPFCITIPW
jgi:hypothetical protein